MPSLFALSDPHLSLDRRKAMDVFGPRWRGYMDLIPANWLRVVAPRDTVLVPGDISWGMRPADALPDLEFLAGLPGRKVLLRGNHDYWWQGISKLRSLNLPGVYFIQNDHVVLDGVAIGGSRLWEFPFTKWRFKSNADNPDVAAEKRSLPPAQRDEDPERIRARELQRLEASLSGLPGSADYRVAITHFPPIADDGEPTPVTDVIAKFDIDLCVYGHVHALPEGVHPAADVVIGRTRYVLASSDYLSHTPVLLR